MLMIRSVPGDRPVRSDQLSDIAFCAWIGQAEPGELLRYHEGFLGIDTMAGMSSLAEADRKTLCGIARVALSAFENGLIHLVQSRLATDRFAYLAVARQRPRNAPALLTQLLAEPDAGSRSSYTSRLAA